MPDEQDPNDPVGSPVAWATSGTDLRPLYQRLIAAFPRTGLWPIVGGGLGGIDRLGTNVTLATRDKPAGDAFAVVKRYGGENISALAPGVDPIPAMDPRLSCPIPGLLGGPGGCRRTVIASS